MADKRKGKKRKKIYKQLDRKIKQRKDEREVILQQLALLDAEIDNIDEFIIKIDKKIPPLVEEINEKVDEVKAAFDAEISSGCKNNLEWVQQGEVTSGRGGSQGVVNYIAKPTVGLTNSPKTAVKYFKKQQNRDYGTSIVANFVGIITAGHDVMAVVDGQEPADIGIRIGDSLTDSFVLPQTFSIGDLPTVVGFGTTTAVSISTSIGGYISAGSSIFGHSGIGTTTGLSVGDIMILPSHFDQDTTVVGFGTTSIIVRIQDSTTNPPTMTNTIFDVPTVILDKNAIASTTTPIEVSVGIRSTFPSLELDETAVSDAILFKFAAYRVDRDARNQIVSYGSNSIDDNFDYTKSPIDPLEIGLIRDQTLGFGHSIFFTDNGDNVPPGFTTEWQSQKSITPYKIKGIKDDHPEPKVGGGTVQYNDGNNLWPIIVDDDGGSRVPSTEHAVSGSPLQVPAGTSLASFYVATPPGIPPSAQTCNTLSTATTDALAALAATRAENDPKIKKFIKKSKVLRTLRDELELEAWGLLQAAAYCKHKITKMRGEKKELQDEQEMDEFDPD